VDHHQLYIHRLVGTRGPQAPAMFRRILFGKFKPQISHAPQTRFFKMNGRLRNPAQSIACKSVPIPLPFTRLRFSDLSVGQPFRRYRASKKEKKCLQAVKFGSFSRERLSCSLLCGSTATKQIFLRKQLRRPPSYASQTRFHPVFLKTRAMHPHSSCTLHLRAMYPPSS